MNEINAQAIHDYLNPVIAVLSPQSRKTMANEIARSLQKTNSERIKSNVDPAGKAFTARKAQENHKAKTGPMMPKLFRLKHLQRKTTPNGLEIGFLGRSKHVAEVHHFGLKDKVNTNHEADYHARELLGITESDSQLTLDIVLKTLEAAIK